MADQGSVEQRRVPRQRRSGATRRAATRRGAADGTAQLASGEEQLVVRVDGKQVPQMGDTITLIVPPGNEHAFHPETGERLGD